MIGRNQNCWKECKLDLLEEEGGTFVRRRSGGGAVYHDLGNLNFTFLTTKSDYHLEKQIQVVLEAVNSFGLHARSEGRNDLVINGRKFSEMPLWKSITDAVTTEQLWCRWIWNVCPAT